MFICSEISGIFDQASAAKSHQSYPTLCDPIDGSPSGSPIPGILQARILERVAISSSSAWKWSLSFVSNSLRPWTAAYQALPSIRFPRQEYWSGLPLPSPLIKLVNVKVKLLKFCFQLFFSLCLILALIAPNVLPFKFNYIQFVFAFISFALGDWSKKILLWFMSKCSLPVFSFCFIVPSVILGL